MKSKIFLLSFLNLFLLTACQNPKEPKSEETPSIESSSTDVKATSLEADIKFIQEKYKIISEATDWKTVPVVTQCEEIGETQLVRKYNEKGELAYLELTQCGGHGCLSKEHYYWDGKLIFLFSKNDFTPGSSHIIEEHRTYFKEGTMIRCLEKQAAYHEGQPPMEELLKKAVNKEVDCAPAKLTTNLSKIESLSVEEAQKYFCPPSQQMLGTFYSSDCSKHLEMEAFNCECVFSSNGGNKEPAVFVSNMEEKACVKVDGQLNALYPDWEGRDYKKELKALANAKNWLSVEGQNINYFGQALSFYKYESAVEFLTDVILASNKNIDKIPIPGSIANEMRVKLETQTQKAIAKAKEYKAKGGEDPLTIVKFDNRTYDVFLRYRQTTQFEGEANQYEGEITLLKNRGTEILETKPLKGTCGC